MAGVTNSPSRRSINFQQALQGFMLCSKLPFATLLSQDLIHEIFTKHRSHFGGIFNTAIVLWAFLSQVLRDGKEASCQAALARISAYLVTHKRHAPDSNTGDYCKARSKLSEHALKELSNHVALSTDASAERRWKWKGKRTFLVDGFTFKMPDTLENQKAYPQHTAQKPGLGFPIARAVVLLSLATACIMDAAIGPYQGKESGETALLRKLFCTLKEGDVVVADRYYCSYWMICFLMQLGVHVCFRQHQVRHTDFRKGKRLGAKDHIVTWTRPANRPAWMNRLEYDSMPKEIRLREIAYCVEQPGRKQSPFVIVTTMLSEGDEDWISKAELAELYGFRWNAELDIRAIKTHMNLGFLRCKSPQMIHKEFWVTLLAYNLIRSTIALSAHLFGQLPRAISFTCACQYVLSSWTAWQTKAQDIKKIDWTEYCLGMLEAISERQVANRPGRFEPRVIKRRRDQYTLMTQPRNDLRERLARGDNAFE